MLSKTQIIRTASRTSASRRAPRSKSKYTSKIKEKISTPRWIVEFLQKTKALTRRERDYPILRSIHNKGNPREERERVRQATLNWCSVVPPEVSPTCVPTVMSAGLWVETPWGCPLRGSGGWNVDEEVRDEMIFHGIEKRMTLVDS